MLPLQQQLQTLMFFALHHHWSPQLCLKTQTIIATSMVFQLDTNVPTPLMAAVNSQHVCCMGEQVKAYPKGR